MRRICQPNTFERFHVVHITRREHREAPALRTETPVLFIRHTSLHTPCIYVRLCLSIIKPADRHMVHGETDHLQNSKPNAWRRDGEASHCRRFPLTFNRPRSIVLLVPSQPLSNTWDAYHSMCRGSIILSFTLNGAHDLVSDTVSVRADLNPTLS